MGSTAVLLLLVGFIWRVPQWGLSQSITDEKVKAELLNANRDNLLKGVQAISGLAFVVTAVLAWKNLQLTEAKNVSDRQLTEDKNVTDRFSKAVEMLADSEKLEVRLGGIYSLERIARDSKTDHSVVMEVLTAFVRARGKPEDEKRKPLPQDIQSALTVIGRRTPIENEQTISLGYTDIGGANLSHSNLSHSNLEMGNLEGANLSHADLSGASLFLTRLEWAKLNEADLSKADLRGANLSHADLSGANLSGANLQGANLETANLARANLDGANLETAKLRWANLDGAKLNGADLKGTDLKGVNLRGANLRGVNLKEAIILNGVVARAYNIPDDEYAKTVLARSKRRKVDLEGIAWDEKTAWPDITEVAEAMNIPAALKTQLGIEVTPPDGPEHP